MSLSVAGSSYLKKKRTYRQLLVIYINSIILEHYLCLDWTITTWPETTNITNPKLLQAYYCFSPPLPKEGETKRWPAFHFQCLTLSFVPPQQGLGQKVITNNSQVFALICLTCQMDADSCQGSSARLAISHFQVLF